jgi:hypothetical protein
MTDAKIIIEISRTFFFLASKRQIEETSDHSTVIETVLREMGINISVDAPCEGNTYGHQGPYSSLAQRWDELTRHNGESGRYPTWAGEQLIRAECSYGYRTLEFERFPAREARPEEMEIRYGDPAYGYVSLVPFNRRLPDTLVERVHLLLHKEVPRLLMELKEEREAARKEWGREQTRLLREAGCNQAAVSAWWNLQWKKEVSPEYWAKLVQSTPTETIRLGLRAHAKWALERLGAPNRGSFPRSMDLLHGLAKAHGLKPASKQAYKAAIEGDVVSDVSPKKIDEKGQRIWSF